MRADITERIAEAIADYSRIFPVPYSLAANLQLASEAAAELHGLREALRASLAAVGLPENADLATLISHHRANAGAAVAFELIAAAGHGAEPLSDAEWREFQNIPEQGYSHRTWVDRQIAKRVAAATEIPLD